MKRLSITSLCVLVAATMVLLTGARLADAVDCNPSELDSCLGAIKSSTPPSGTCCLKLEDQAPCLCGYFKNPDFKPYIRGGRRVVDACGLTVPRC